MTTSAAMIDHMASNVTTLVPIWKMTAVDGTIAAYCCHTRPLVFGGVTYNASAVENARPMQKIGLQPNTVAITGVFDEIVLRPDIEADFWKGASIIFEVVNYMDLTMLSTQKIQGFVGKIEVLNKVAYKIEFVSLSDSVQPLLGQTTSPVDRNAFPAGVNVATYTFSATITDVIDRTHFKVDYDQTEPDYFKYGIVRWISANSFYAFTTAAYLGAVNRNPTGPELTTWNTSLITGWNTDQSALQTAAAALLETLFASGEYTALATSNQQFVEDLYESYLGRASDPSGRKFWMDQLATISRAQLRSIFAFSDEFRLRLLQIRVNNGLEMDIKSSTTTDGATKTLIEMQEPLPSTPNVGDSLQLVAGYDGTRKQARDKFGAIIDMDAEPDLPGLKAIIKYPE